MLSHKRAVSNNNKFLTKAAENHYPCVMLPSDIRDLKTGGIGHLSSDGRFPDYVRRLFDVKQMDFEAAFDQILTLLSWEPQRMYVLCS